jgi:hypothetical protein
MNRTIPPPRPPCHPHLSSRLRIRPAPHEPHETPQDEPAGVSRRF